MSTRGCIARVTGEGKFEGRYNHWDSYPTALGKTLYKLHNGFFKGDLPKMLAFLIDAHKAGWSTINGADFNLPAGYSDGPRYKIVRGKTDYTKPIPYGPVCFCHGERHEEPCLVDQDTDSGMEYGYVFDEEKHTMYVLERVLTDDTGHGGRHMTGLFGYGAEGHQRWADIGTVELDAAEPDWGKIECGEHYERCRHYASTHIKELKDTPSANLSMRDYLSENPELGRNDAVAYIVNGKVAKDGGSGYSGGFGWKPGTQRGVWYQSLVFADGKRRDVPVAYVGKEEKPYKGVVWIFPPTMHAGFTTCPNVDDKVLKKALAGLKVAAETASNLKSA